MGAWANAVELSDQIATRSNHCSSHWLKRAGASLEAQLLFRPDVMKKATDCTDPTRRNNEQ
jgi:hypothetical protein